MATIDSDLFDGPGVYEGILRITLGDLVAVDDIVIEIVAAGGGAMMAEMVETAATEATVVAPYPNRPRQPLWRPGLVHWP